MSTTFRSSVTYKRGWESLPVPPLYFDEDTDCTNTAGAFPSTSKTSDDRHVYPHLYTYSSGGMHYISPLLPHVSPTRFSSTAIQEWNGEIPHTDKEDLFCHGHESPRRSSSYLRSTFGTTTSSMKQPKTPPTSPYPWKKAVRTPPSTRTVSTAAMTPQSVTSLTSYLSPPPSDRLVYVGGKGMATPGYHQNKIQREHGAESPTWVGSPSIDHPSARRDTSYVSVTKTASTKGKHDLPSPSKRSPTKKKQALSTSVNAVNPQSDDTNRKQRAKTELCMHYLQGKTCPFGTSCTYAHGESELQNKNLVDLQRAGLVDDIENYRTKPCFNFVALGSCPFGRRCSAIHDPRVIGNVPSWLALTETQGNNLATDINVEGLHQKRYSSIISGNPFGEQFSVEFDGWNDLYKLVTNSSATPKRRKGSISEVHKLSIAIQLRGSHEWMYKYCPQHVVYQETCMVLQQKSFFLESESGEAIPISDECYNASDSRHVMAYEIAFGPDSDPSIRGVALWFNIPSNEVKECTPQQAKRFRWRKTSKYDDVKGEKKTAFDARECFAMIRPHDRNAFALATRILEHRFATVRAERKTSMVERFQLLKQLKLEHDILREVFEGQKRDWTRWAYPISNGRQRFDEETPVPCVDSRYNPIIDNAAFTSAEDSNDPGQVVAGSAVQKIWLSFVANMEQENGNSDQKRSMQDTSALEGRRNRLSKFRSRLSIFSKLSAGETISPDRSLPHIVDPLQKKERSDKSKQSAYSTQSERCWKSLLLKPENPEELSEWDIVKDHFQNFSRSKKVLSIIQQ